MRSIKHDPGPNPFVLGAVVAIGDGRKPYRKAFVSKVLANATFFVAGGDLLQEDAKALGRFKRHNVETAWPLIRYRNHFIARIWTKDVDAQQAELIFARDHFVSALAIRSLFERPDLLDRGFVARIARVIAAEAVVALGTKR